MRAILRLFLLVAGVLIATPASASAHAVLEGTEPLAGATVKSPPEQLVFRFSEPVEGQFGAIQVFSVDGDRVESGEAFHPADHSSELAVRLKSNLADGTYTSTYRIVSADGHPVSGGLVYSLGKPSAAAGTTVSELLEQRGEAGPATDIGFGIARGLTYAAIALCIGSIFFLFAIWPPSLARVVGAGDAWMRASETFEGRLRTVLIAASGVGAASAALGIVFQGANAAGVSFWSALDPDIWTKVLETRFGLIWALRGATFVAFGLVASQLVGRRAAMLRPATVGATGLAPVGRPSLATVALFALPGAFLAISPALSGHATLQDPTAVLVPANVLHVLAVSVWIGGLVVLVTALPRVTGRLEPVDRTRVLASTVINFSQVAGIAVAVILAMGVLQAIFEVETVGNLTGTKFGWAVLIKLGLFTGLVALGGFNRQYMIPRLRRLADSGEPPGHAGLLLRRALRAEVALAVVVFGVTAALVSYAPSSAVSTGGPVAETRAIGPADVQLTVDPARVGANEMHVYLTDRVTGAPFKGAKEFRAEASLSEKDVAPIDLDTRRAGPGHYVMPGATFGLKGEWILHLVMRVSAFDEHDVDVEVPIR